MSLNAWEWTVTRQSHWHDGIQIVEITQGGIDYSGPDALCKKYPGEFETFQGMTDAVEAAIAIAEAWKKDTKHKIYIGTGCTHGMGLTLDEEPTTKKTYAALRKAAKEFDEKLPRCANCGDILGKEKYGCWEIGEFDCCSEYCAEKHYAPLEEECEI